MTAGIRSYALDIPFCHAVVRAKLNSEAVVTLIRTQEESNSRGRLDWVAAGKAAARKMEIPSL